MTTNDDWRYHVRQAGLALVLLAIVAVAVAGATYGPGLWRAAREKAEQVKVEWSADPLVSDMADYLVTGAAEGNANGTFAESGTYNGLPSYVNGAGWRLFNDGNPGGPVWTISAAEGTYFPGYLGPGSGSITGAYSPAGYDPGDATVSEAASTFSITGFVIDANGNGTSGVSVSASCTGKADVTDTTDAAGAFSLDVEAGTWTVSVSKTGCKFHSTGQPWATVSAQTVVVAGATVMPENFFAEVRVSGTFTDGSAQPLAGRVVAVHKNPSDGLEYGNRVRSNGAGLFEEFLSYQGDFRLTPERYGAVLLDFTPAYRDVTVDSDPISGQDFVGVPATGYPVTGRVTVSGVGRAGVSVQVTGTLTTSATTDGTGAFAVSLPDGSYTLRAVAAGLVFSPTTQAVTVSGAAVGDVDFAAVGTGTLSGRVVGPTGAGLPFVLLTATGGYQTYTGADGSFVFSGIPPGPTIITPALAGYTFLPATRQVQVAGSVSGVDFAATVVAPTYVASGSVTSGSTWIGGVLIQAGSRFTYTAADGSWMISGLPDGAYTFTPSLPGYTFAPTSRAVVIDGDHEAGIDFEATAPAGVFSIGGTVLDGDGDPVEEVVFLLGGFAFATDNTGAYLITNLTAGTYIVTPVLAEYTFAPTHLDVVIVAANVTGQNFVGTAIGDTVDPVVTILTPADAAEVTGPVEVTWAASDDVGVVVCRVLIDGNTQETFDLGLAYSYTWNPSGWSNGEHTLRVEADDAAGNTGYDEITVTVNRSLATGTKYLFTVPLPGSAENPNQWRLSAVVKAALGMFTPGEIVLPADPAECNNVLVGIAPAATDLTDPAAAWASAFHIVTPERSFTWPADCASGFILGLRAQPQVVWSYWEDTDYDALWQIIPLPSGDLALLTEGPTALLKLSTAGNLSVLEALTLPNGNPPSIVGGAAYAGGKVFVALDQYLLAKDLDTGDLTVDLTLAGVTSIDALCASGDTLYLATNSGTGAALYSFTWPSARLVATLPARASALLAVGNLIIIGGQDGTMYIRVGAAVTTLYDPTNDQSGFPPDFYRFVRDGNVTWALTGDAGRLYRSSPSWQLDNSFALTQLYGAAAYGDDLYLGGNGDALWRLHAGTWASWVELAGVTAINDLYATADALYVAATHSSGARLYRLEISAPGGFTCGADPPDFEAGTLHYV